MQFIDYIHKNEDVSILDECPNNNLLTEAGLSRVLQKIKQENNDFAVISAYRDKYDKKENIKRNRKLRTEFNKKKMGVYQLIGHWRECQLEDVDYEDCPKEYIVDAIERSYLVIKPKEMEQESFKDLIHDMTKRYKQDASVITLDGIIYTIEPTGKMSKIGDTITLNKIAQAYSRHVKKQNLPFVFEAEVPSTNNGRRLFRLNNLLYPRNCAKEELREMGDRYFDKSS